MDRADRPEGDIADIQSGWDVYGADEQKVGNVDRVEQGCVVAHKGIFFPKDLYIPLAAIRRIEHDRVYLNVDKNAVEYQGWDTEPVATPDYTASGLGPAGAVGERTAAPARTAEGERTLHLREEELRVNKERSRAGEVRVGKEVVEEQRTIDVPVTREEVVIERTPGDMQPDDHAVGEHAGETIRVPVSEERVDVEKVAVETEEVRVGKREVTEQRQVTDTVRREEARIDTEGDVRVQGADQPSRPAPGPADRGR
jgi:uncharacterized protein (TIGR02271 family)